MLFFETQAAADLEVAFDYTIPEPMTVFFLCLGSLGLVLRRKRYH
ncbi:PEP-CTERM sorting domain-containing protein [Planctomycetota bacterium]